MKKMRLFTFWIGLMVFCLLLAFLLPGLPTAVEKKRDDSASKYDEVANKWGIRPLSIRLTGSDRFLDFRYLVINVEKARPIMQREKRAILKDQETGETFHVTMTKVGAMRGTVNALKQGSRYFMLFANSDKSIRRGNKVSVIIGDCMVEDLKVK